MIALIDGDLVSYRCAASCEKQGVLVEDLGIAQARARDLIHRMCVANGAEGDFQIYISGGENFRKKINPAYKANRDDVKRPEYLKPLNEWLVEYMGAIITDGIEADDALGIDQTKYNEQGIDSVICTLDKDLRQVPGAHYSWEISGVSTTGKQWVRPEEKLIVSPDEGLFNFHWQLIMGDASDNIFGFDGKARQKVPKFLEDWYHEMQTLSPEEQFAFVREKYNDDERLLMNGACLWILRSEDDDWLEKHSTVVHGQKGATEPS